MKVDVKGFKQLYLLRGAKGRDSSWAKQKARLDKRALRLFILQTKLINLSRNLVRHWKQF